MAQCCIGITFSVPRNNNTHSLVNIITVDDVRHFREEVKLNVNPSGYLYKLLSPETSANLNEDCVCNFDPYMLYFSAMLRDHQTANQRNALISSECGICNVKLKTMS